MNRHRAAIATALASVLLAGCGPGSAGSDTASAPKTGATESAEVETPVGVEPGASQSADATYFTADDTNVINKAAAAAQSAAAKATATRRVTACNDIDAYPGWRRCWHALLDPYSNGLTELVAVLTSLQGDGFPTACRAGLADGARTFTSFTGKVKALLAGIDSNERSQQVRSAKRYGPTLNRIAGGFSKPFQNLTQVCYSPEDLASINASPTPSP